MKEELLFFKDKFKNGEGIAEGISGKIFQFFFIKGNLVVSKIKIRKNSIFSIILHENLVFLDFLF